MRAQRSDAVAFITRGAPTVSVIIPPSLSDHRIRQLLNQITAIEAELKAALQEHESQVLFTFKGKRIALERAVKESHP